MFTLNQLGAQKSVTASAPGKLMLAGSYAVVHGYSCVATAVNQRIQATVLLNEEPFLRINAPDLGLNDYAKSLTEVGVGQLPKQAQFIEFLYQRFLKLHPQTSGITVSTASEFSSLVGFGSSSAVTVAFAKALFSAYQIEITNKELFDICYQTVLDVQGVGSGYDIAMAIWGGTLLYQLPAKRVEPIAVPQLPLVVGYTGVKADTATLVKMVDQTYHQPGSPAPALFEQIGRVADQMKPALAASDWQAAGSLLTQHHALTQQLGVSSQLLDTLVAAANDAGAYGAALSGAGGGDCMIALVADEQRAALEQAITDAGGTVILVEVDAKGVQVDV